MTTVVISAHITIDGVLRVPGTIIELEDALAHNLIASGYAHLADAGIEPDVILASHVLVLNLGDVIPDGLPVGTVILRRPA